MLSVAESIDTEVAKIVARPYIRELLPNEDGTWFARIVELPGCMTEGDTPEEAIHNLREAMDLWVRTALEDGQPIPEALHDREFSGKFVVRIPPDLHRDLTRRAMSENVSLNQHIVAALARSVGRTAP